MIRGFTVVNHRFARIDHPVEDCFEFDESMGVLAVADGVTRDPSVVLPDVRELEGWERFMAGYPTPSGARRAAEVFCRTVVERVRDWPTQSLGEAAMLDLFAEANERIARLNREENQPADYLVNDYFACVAAVAIEIPPNRLVYGALPDCAVAVLDSESRIRLQTGNEDLERSRAARRALLRSLGLHWTHPAARYITRRSFRNNRAEPRSYGVLTGEPQALGYVRTGTAEKQIGDTLLVYSDGIEPILFDRCGDIADGFADALRAASSGDADWTVVETYCRERVKTEGTLVVSWGDRDRGAD